MTYDPDDDDDDDDTGDWDTDEGGKQWYPWDRSPLTPTPEVPTDGWFGGGEG